jgi:hypothetical protein
VIGDAMYGADVRSAPIHPRGRLAQYQILRYSLIGPIEGPTVRVKGSAHSRMLLDAGADPNIHDDKYEATAVGWAEFCARDRS